MQCPRYHTGKHVYNHPFLLQNSVTLCAYPFVLNAKAKTTMLQTDAELQMQVPVYPTAVVKVDVLICD